MKGYAGNRILMLLENNAYPDDTRVLKEATTLRDAGYHVTVICPTDDDARKFYEDVDGVYVYRYPEPPEAQSFLGYAWEYGYSLVAAFILSIVVFFTKGFDVIHAHNPPDLYVFIGLFFKKLFGKKFVFDHHDLSPENYQARFGFDNHNPKVFKTLLWLERLTFKTADHVISTNQSYKLIAQERGGVAEENITIVRNGPNLKRIRRVEPDAEIKAKAPTIFGYIGVMGPQDGIDYFLRAMHHMIHDLGRTDFYAVLVGSGNALNSLKKLKSELGLDDYVKFTGYVTDEEMRRYMSSVDIGIDPDPSNPFNDRCTMIKMTEYMALGIPIVAFDLPEHRFTAEQAAIYVPDNSELKLAQTMSALMDDPESQKAMSAYGRQRIETQLAWPYSATKLIEVYQKLLPLQVKTQKDVAHA